MRSLYFKRSVAIGLLTCVSNLSFADPSPSPYSSSPSIEAEPLDATLSSALSEFLKRPIKSQTQSVLGASFCRPVVTRPTPQANDVKVALALVESEVVPILSFSQPAEGDKKPISINYSVEFGLDTVKLRSSNPRYPSQSAGLQVAYPHDTTRSIWFEGKDDANVLFLVPPVRNCNIQFVVACPRTYSISRSLDETKLTLAGIRYLVSAKADGLFKAPEGEEGKIFAAGLASSRIKLPSTWSTDNVSSETPSTSFKIQMPLDVLSSEDSFTPASLPMVDAIEARLEFGSSSTVRRVIRSRATIELSNYLLERTQPIRVERSEATLNQGSCIVISRRKESHY
jgi:hypothetical protein